jgi:predicted ATP-grasp superfamily ATP-dependent carboligase
MINFIVVGKCRRVMSAVLQAMRSFTDAKCVVIGGPETAVFRWSALCKRQITMDLDGNDDEIFVGVLNAIVRNRPHVILIPADCDGIRLVNRVRDRLTLCVMPIPEPAVLDMFDNKWLFHQFCTRNALRVPETRFVPSKADLDYDAMAADLGVPFLVKPLDRAGSTGVHVVRSKADFDQSIRYNDGYDYGPLIAQRHIDGVDIDVSMLSIHGRISAMAIQQASDSRIVFMSNPELEAMARRLCDASAYHGVMHVDARIETATGKVFLIESNPRFWASLTASVWCGLNFVAESIVPAPHGNEGRQLTKGTAYTRHPLIRPASWRMLVADPGGRGRLLRAMAFDPPAFGAFVRALPAAGWRFASNRAATLVKGLRRRSEVGLLEEEIV